MKNTCAFIIPLIISVFFVSCSDEDNINQSVVPIGTVFFATDSMVAKIDSGGYYTTGLGTLFHQTIAAFKVKVEYRLQSNCDSSAGVIVSINDSTNGSPQTPETLYFYRPVDTLLSSVYDVDNLSFYYNFNSWLSVSRTTIITRYIRILDLKITKVQ